MQVPRIQASLPEATSRFACRSKGFTPLRPTLGAIFLLLLLVHVLTFCAVAEAGTNQGPNSSVRADQNAAPGGGGPTNWEQIEEVVVIGLCSACFAWMRVSSEFHRYRGLLRYVFWHWAGWLFVFFAVVVAFIPDWVVHKYVVKLLHLIGEPTTTMFATLSFLAIHVGASRLSASATPIVLNLFPKQYLASDKTGEKRTSEMNVVFQELHESLETRLHCRVEDWTRTYDWPEIKRTARGLITDLFHSGMLQQQEAERLRLEVDACKKSDDADDDFQCKYELLKKMMDYSSYWDLDLRLEFSGKVTAS
jgi:hypothetical protein